MLKYGLLFIVFLCSHKVSHGMFQKISELNGDWSDIAENVKHSVVKFDIIGSGRCTGTVISQEGHVLTAMHCFHNCLKATRSYKIHKIKNSDRVDYFATIDQSKLPTCNLRYKKYSFEDDDDLQAEIEYEDAELIATGQGKILLNQTNPQIDTIIDFHLSNKEDFQYLRSIGIGRIVGDYAIFKSKAFAKRRCIDLKPSLKAKKLLSLSFPNYTFSRETGVNPNGRSMYASVGEISNIGVLRSDSAFVTSLKEGHSFQEINDAYTFKDDIVWSDNDTIGGASGSLTFNEFGFPHSLVVYNLCDSWSAQNEGCKFSTGSIKVSKILSDLKSIHTTESMEKIFSCIRKN